MTREELIEQLEILREVVERLAVGVAPAVLEDLDRFRGRLPADDRLARDDANNRSGRVDHDKIAKVLAGEAPTTTLNDEERAIWSEQFLAALGEPGPEEEAFMARLRRELDGEDQ